MRKKVRRNKIALALAILACIIATRSSASGEVDEKQQKRIWEDADIDAYIDDKIEKKLKDTATAKAKIAVCE